MDHDYGNRCFLYLVFSSQVAIPDLIPNSRAILLLVVWTQADAHHCFSRLIFCNSMPVSSCYFFFFGTMRFGGWCRSNGSRHQNKALILRSWWTCPNRSGTRYTCLVVGFGSKVVLPDVFWYTVLLSAILFWHEQTSWFSSFQSLSTSLTSIEWSEMNLWRVLGYNIGESQIIWLSDGDRYAIRREDMDIGHN